MKDKIGRAGLPWDGDQKEIPHPALCLGYEGAQDFGSLEDRIENSLKIVARIIVDGAEEYLPIFERLEDELRILKKRKQTFARLQDYLGD